MVWFVQPLEKKGADGMGCGIWHLIADSDEDGGFVVGCSHDHTSAEEAQNCRDAKVYLGKMTGFPYQPQTITINGVSREIDDREITHERICELAGKPVHASVTYSGPKRGDSQRSGMTYAGESVKLEDGMIFDCVVTGNA